MGVKKHISRAVVRTLELTEEDRVLLTVALQHTRTSGLTGVANQHARVLSGRWARVDELLKRLA